VNCGGGATGDGPIERDTHVASKLGCLFYLFGCLGKCSS
jgi:hypothetical protein